MNCLLVEEVRRDLVSNFNRDISLINQREKLTGTSHSDSIRNDMIKELSSIHNINLEELDKYSKSYKRKRFDNKEEFKSNIFSRFYIYFDTLYSNMKMGSLLITDWFIDENQQKYLRYLKNNFNFCKIF